MTFSADQVVIKCRLSLQTFHLHIRHKRYDDVDSFNELYTLYTMYSLAKMNTSSHQLYTNTIDANRHSIYVGQTRITEQTTHVTTNKACNCEGRFTVIYVLNYVYINIGGTFHQVSLQSTIKP